MSTNGDMMSTAKGTSKMPDFLSEALADPNRGRFRAQFTEERTVPLELDMELEKLMKQPSQKGSRLLDMIAQFGKFP